jgi:hypothetical protein
MSDSPPSPTRAELARDLLLYKMEEYSEDFACASWLVNLEFELWNFADITSTDSKDQYSITLGKELRTLSEIAGGWWAWDDEISPNDNPVFMPLEKWQKVLSNRLEEREI